MEPETSGPETGIPAADVAAMNDGQRTELRPGEKLRGFEITYTDGYGIERQYGKFRPTELALRQAATELKWLRARAADAKMTGTYELRAIISIPQPEPGATNG